MTKIGAKPNWLTLSESSPRTKMTAEKIAMNLLRDEDFISNLMYKKLSYQGYLPSLTHSMKWTTKKKSKRNI